MSDTAKLTEGLPSHIQPGVVIAGKYRLEAEIGRGSMGTVYRAIHVTLGQRVAIKLISSEHLQSQEARSRFSVEAKAAAKLRSRHVVQIYDDGETPEGNPYIVLEYLEGETLEERLEREHDVPLTDAVRIVTHVGRALARAHAQGIVHRDLKPANVFLVRAEDEEHGWVAKVLDFGIAKLDGQSGMGTTQAGTVLGTPLFMSPEQIRGASSVDHRADLYSLGMCLFHMLTGDFAYYAPNYSDVLISICTLPLPSLREKAPWVPEAVEQWFQRACAKEPLERFQSADELTEALHAAAGGPALSKHQSVAEGRIAPETLVGYAAPTAATLQLDAVAAGLARTQQIAVDAPVGPRLSAAASQVTLALAAPNQSATSTHDWTPPPRGLPPWALGTLIGLGVVALGAALALLQRDGEQSRPTATASSSPPALVPSTPALPSPPPPSAPEVQPTLTGAAPTVVSSVAADSPAPLAGPDEAAKLPAKKPPAPVPAAPRKPPAPGTVNKPAVSDLGF